MDKINLAESIQLARVGKLEGLYEMEEDDYRAAPGLNQSSLKSMLLCPAVYHSDKSKPFKRSKALELGTLIHALLLEGREAFDKLAIQGPDVDARTKAFREFRTEHPDKIVLTKFDVQMIQGVWQSAADNTFVQSVLGRCLKEIVVFAIDPATGVLMKGKIDLLSLTQPFIGDVKTTASAAPDEFKQSIRKYKYEFQAAYYLRLVTLATGRRYSDFGFLAVEKVEPYLWGFYKASPKRLIGAEFLLDQCLRQYAESEKTGVWPGYPERFIELD